MTEHYESIKTLLLTLLTAAIVLKNYIPIYKAKKLIKAFGKPKQVFRVNTLKIYGKLALLFLVLILILSFISLTLVDYLYVIVFMSFIFLLGYKLTRCIHIYEEGIYINSRFINWKDIKTIKSTNNTILLITDLSGYKKVINRNVINGDALGETLRQERIE